MAHTIHTFFHDDTFTFTHVLVDSASRDAAIIDPVLDFDQKSGRTSTVSIDAVLAFAEQQSLQLRWVLETHAHADHLSAATIIRQRTGAKIAIGAAIQGVQRVFKSIFNEDTDFPTDGSQFDHLVHDGEQLALGDTKIEVIATPGHTPACVSYRVQDDIFVGDTLFMPDVGTARCDFPGGDAVTLYHSIQRLLSYEKHTRLHLCHDYPPNDRSVVSVTTVGDQRARNIHVRDGVTCDEFVAMRSQRDQGLDMPRLILPSLQINIRAGDVPKPENNGTSYLKIPLNLL